MSALREARQARGWSSAQLQFRLARTAKERTVAIAASSSLRVMISRWENGHANPDPAYRALLEAVFGLPAAALGFPGDVDHEPTGEVSALVEHVRDRVDAAPAVVEYFAGQLAEHTRFDNLAGPSFILPAVSAQLSQVEALAARGSIDAARLAARFAEFVGWLHQDSGDTTQALALTDRSVDYADAAGDDELATYNLMRKANVLGSVGQTRLAASTAQRALARAEQQFPALVPICLRQQAVAASRLGDEPTARGAIETALQLTDASMSGPANLSPYCTTSYVQMEAAFCLLALRQPAAAEEACTAALTDWPAALVRDRTLCQARRGIALVELREVEEACQAALLALDGVRSAPSGRAIHLLRTIATRLRPFGRNPSVRELTTALAEVA